MTSSSPMGRAPKPVTSHPVGMYTGRQGIPWGRLLLAAGLGLGVLVVVLMMIQA